MALTCSNFFSIIEDARQDYMASPAPQEIGHFSVLSIVDRVRPAERHQCERRTLVYRSTYTNRQEVKQGICFHVVDEEDQVVCAIAHTRGAAKRYKVPFQTPDLTRYSDLNRDTSHLNLKKVVFVLKGRLTGWEDGYGIKTCRQSGHSRSQARSRRLHS